MPHIGDKFVQQLKSGVHFARLLVLRIFIALLLPACSMKLSHPDGTTTYVGVVNLREGQARDSTLLHSRRYGVVLDAGVATNGFTLGYEDRLLVKPPGDAVTSIDYEPGTDPEVFIQSAR